MNILFIDCSNGLKVGIISSDFTKQVVDNTSKKHSSSLMTVIDNLLAEAKLKMNNIDVIAVCVGPGSFTGIRVAIATAKGLSIGSNAKVITFTSFDTIVVPDKNYGVIVEGFGNNYYYHFKKFGKTFEGCNTPDKLLVFAEGINVYSNSNVVNLPFEVKQTEYCPANIINKKIEQNQFILTNQIAPLYLRASQAEIERLKNGN